MVRSMVAGPLDQDAQRRTDQAGEVLRAKLGFDRRQPGFGKPVDQLDFDPDEPSFVRDSDQLLRRFIWSGDDNVCVDSSNVVTLKMK